MYCLSGSICKQFRLDVVALAAVPMLVLCSQYPTTHITWHLPFPITCQQFELLMSFPSCWTYFLCKLTVPANKYLQLLQNALATCMCRYAWLGAINFRCNKKDSVQTSCTEFTKHGIYYTKIMIYGRLLYWRLHLNTLAMYCIRGMNLSIH